MRMLRDAGFLSAEPVEIGGARLSPIELTGRLLFPLWQYGPGEEDMTLFFCEADGVKDGAPVQARWIMLDRYDRAAGVSSMARTTGYTATAALRLPARPARPPRHPAGAGRLSRRPLWLRHAA